MRSARLSVACLAVLLATAGCGGKASVNQAGPPCETRVVAAHPADTLTVVVFDEINPLHAPTPHNREEQFVFSHLYETLVNIDCNGVVQPGLAKSWKPGSDGWLIELRDGAQYWDQTKVTAQDIVRSFEPAIRAGLAIASVDPVDEHTVLIKGAHGPPDIKLLALPIVAIRNEWGVTGPAIGTGSWQFDTHIPFGEAVAIEPVVGALGPLVRFVQANPSDAKDLVAGKADAMITDDPAVLDYARDKGRIAPVPLPWDGVYVLLSTSRSLAIDKGTSVASIPASVCNSLAKDAVGVDARGSSMLVKDAEAICQPQLVAHIADGGYGSFGSNRRVVFDSSDPTSRSLAERLVSLAAMDTTASAQARAIVRAIPGASAGMRAAGIEPTRFEPQLRTGNEFAYVTRWSWCFFPVVWPHVPDWLLTGVSLTPRVVPLVETRAHFIVMSDRIGFAQDETNRVRILTSQPEQKR